MLRMQMSLESDIDRRASERFHRKPYQSYLIKIIFSNVCQNTIKEFASYIWDAKAAERGEDKPIKQYDHAMDAVRYFVYTIFGDKPRLNRNLKGGL